MTAPSPVHGALVERDGQLRWERPWFTLRILLVDGRTVDVTTQDVTSHLRQAVVDRFGAIAGDTRLPDTTDRQRSLFDTPSVDGGGQ